MSRSLSGLKGSIPDEVDYHKLDGRPKLPIADFINIRQNRTSTPRLSTPALTSITDVFRFGRNVREVCRTRTCADTS